MNASTKNELVRLRIYKQTGVSISESDAAKLRRAATTLQRWHELECGTDSGHVYRSGPGDIPFFQRSGGWYAGKYVQPEPFRIRDTESAALRTVAEVCARNGLTFYVQGDLRGCPLYIGIEPFRESACPSSVGVSVEVR